MSSHPSLQLKLWQRNRMRKQIHFRSSRRCLFLGRMCAQAEIMTEGLWGVMDWLTFLFSVTSITRLTLSTPCGIYTGGIRTNQEPSRQPFVVSVKVHICRAKHKTGCTSMQQAIAIRLDNFVVSVKVHICRTKHTRQDALPCNKQLPFVSTSLICVTSC